MDSSFLDSIIFPNKYVFNVDEKVNEYNLGIRGLENSYEFEEVFCDSKKAMVRCALSIYDVIGPYFFDDPIVIGHSHLHSWINYFILMLSGLPATTIFQKVGAPFHYSREVRDFLDDKMPGLWIGRRCLVNQPARGPDHTFPDYLLWVFVKIKVFTTLRTGLTQ